MHIHPPKPLHGWKEFLNEIFVIVIGVLIALGFEQVVEELHWQHKVHEGEERLRIEASVNVAYAAEQIRISPCVEAQIAELAGRVRASGEQLVPAPLLPINGLGRTVIAITSRPYLSEIWTALVQDGTSTHFDPSAQKLIGMTYTTIDNIRGITRDIRALRGELAVLAEPVPLDATSRLHLLESLNKMSSLNSVRTLMAAQMIASYRLAGVELDEGQIARILKTAPGNLGPGPRCGFGNAEMDDWKKAANEQMDMGRSIAPELYQAK